MAIKTFELVNYEVKDRVAWITINNPARMNALSTGVSNGLWYAFDEAIKDDDVLVIILTSEGGRAFCAGADLKEMTERDHTVGPRGPAAIQTRVGTGDGMFEASHCRHRRICLGGRHATFGALRLSHRHRAIPLWHAGAAAEPDTNQHHGHHGDGVRAAGRGHVDHSLW